MRSVRRYSPNAYDISQPPLVAVLERIHNGEIQLPSFARDWCWSRDHVQRLLETIALGHPMGVATLVNASVAESRNLDVGHVTQNIRVSPMHLLLDGQQRLTAAYRACYAPDGVDVKTSKGVQRHCFFFDMEKAIDASIPMQDALFSIELRADGRPQRRAASQCFGREDQYKLGIVPTNALPAFETYELSFAQYWSENARFTERPEALQKLKHFRGAVVDAFENYKVPVQLLDQPMSPQRLCSASAQLNGRMID